MAIEQLTKLEDKNFSSKKSSFMSAFTLIELVLVIVLTAIIFSTTAVYITAPIKNLADVALRSELINSAELALRRMERDINNAVPNSIRVKTSSGLTALEIVNVVEGFRYRQEIPGAAADILNFGTSDTSFNVLGQFTNATLGSGGGYRIVIYNTGAQGVDSDSPVAGANVYATSGGDGITLPLNSHVITPSGTTVTLSNPGSEGRVVLGTAHQFALQSPTQRMYVVDTPVTYLCDPSSGNIVRYSGYTISATQPIAGASAPLSTANDAILTDNVASCTFTYQPGTSQRNSVVTLDLTLSANGESVRLLQQVGVSNAP